MNNFNLIRKNSSGNPKCTGIKNTITLPTIYIIHFEYLLFLAKGWKIIVKNEMTMTGNIPVMYCYAMRRGEQFCL